jgi:hypothetical protein
VIPVIASVLNLTHYLIRLIAGAFFLPCFYVVKLVLDIVELPPNLRKLEDTPTDNQHHAKKNYGYHVVLKDSGCITSLPAPQRPGETG